VPPAVERRRSQSAARLIKEWMGEALAARLPTRHYASIIEA
jgi:hypothetical protein